MTDHRTPTQFTALLKDDWGKGKPTHDARRVAAMLAHGLTCLLTPNSIHAQRYPGMTALTPAEVLATLP